MGTAGLITWLREIDCRIEVMLTPATRSADDVSLRCKNIFAPQKKLWRSNGARVFAPTYSV
jgi:hypothetical protein